MCCFVMFGPFEHGEDMIRYMHTIPLRFVTHAHTDILVANIWHKKLMAGLAAKVSSGLCMIKSGWNRRFSVGFWVIRGPLGMRWSHSDPEPRMEILICWREILRTGVLSSAAGSFLK